MISPTGQNTFKGKNIKQHVAQKRSCVKDAGLCVCEDLSQIFLEVM
jgi:hypothetical protein